MRKPIKTYKGTNLFLFWKITESSAAMAFTKVLAGYCSAQSFKKLGNKRKIINLSQRSLFSRKINPINFRPSSIKVHFNKSLSPLWWVLMIHSTLIVLRTSWSSILKNSTHITITLCERYSQSQSSITGNVIKSLERSFSKKFKNKSTCQ